MSAHPTARDQLRNHHYNNRRKKRQNNIHRTDTVGETRQHLNPYGESGRQALSCWGAKTRPQGCRTWKACLLVDSWVCTTLRASSSTTRLFSSAIAASSTCSMNGPYTCDDTRDERCLHNCAGTCICMHDFLVRRTGPRGNLWRQGSQLGMGCRQGLVSFIGHSDSRVLMKAQGSYQCTTSRRRLPIKIVEVHFRQSIIASRRIRCSRASRVLRQSAVLSKGLLLGTAHLDARR